MNIRELHLKGFMRHDDSVVRLPSRGLILVTGPNGHGKSSILEGVGYGLWGDTLRGTTPARADGTPLEVTVKAEEVTVTRTRRKTKGSVTWNLPDAEAVEYESTTKAQEALEKVIGEFKVWRWSSVFSSSDAALFTMADDASRKKLIERLIGLERFDEALIKCRMDLNQADARRSAAAGTVDKCMQAANAETRRLDEARESLALIDGAGINGAPVSGMDLKAEWERLRNLAQSANRDLSEIRDQMKKLEDAGRDDLAHAREIDRRLSALAAANCPTCDQPIPESLRDNLRADAEAKRTEATEKQAKAQAQLDALNLEAQEIAEERDAIVGQAERVKEQATEQAAVKRAIQQQAEQVARFQKIIGEAEAALMEVRGRAKTAQAEHAEADAEYNVLKACEKVLGLQGVRAQVLGKALGGLEAVANGWLARIAGDGLTLSLKPYSETKTAGVNDKISLEILGAGDGQGYKAASGGERRRVDIALLFALSEVARAAHGQAPGTIFADEVFDTLDEEGRARLAEALRELAENTAVVVISHIRDLWEDLDPDLHYNVTDGRVSLVNRASTAEGVA